MSLQVEYRDLNISTEALVGSAAVPTVGSSFVNLARVRKQQQGAGVRNLGEVGHRWIGLRINLASRTSTCTDYLPSSPAGWTLTICTPLPLQLRTLPTPPLPPVLQSLVCLKPHTREIKVLQNNNGVILPVSEWSALPVSGVTCR